LQAKRGFSKNWPRLQKRGKTAKSHLKKVKLRQTVNKKLIGTCLKNRMATLRDNGGHQPSSNGLEAIPPVQSVLLGALGGPSQKKRKKGMKPGGGGGYR